MGLAAPVWVVVGVCAGLPLLWLLVQVLTHLNLLAELRLDAFHWQLVGRTIGYNAAAGLVATALGIPVAVVLGRGRGGVARLMWVLLPAALLVPSIVYSYGWSQTLRLLGVRLVPGDLADILRCIGSLGAWLWPIPALAIGLALRRLDADVQQQALLDGRLWRITARLLVGPALAGFGAAFVLALQEFAVYEPTGISVVATEVRTVFDTGSFVSPNIQPLQGFGTAQTQDQRAAAAVVTAVPILAVIAVVTLLAFLARSTGAEQVEVDWPRTLGAGLTMKVIAIAVLLVTIVVPVIALVLSRAHDRPLGFIWDEFAPQVTGSLTIGVATGTIACLVGAWACVVRTRAAALLGVTSFLVGGQLIAIALIRVYNRPWLAAVYDGPVITIMAYLARFAWVALLAADATWTRPWRALRDMAAVDGAGPVRTARSILWPVAAPLLVAAALLVTVLSIGEVPATALLAPIRPPMLVPSLLTWVHTLRFDPMIEASLLMVGLALAAGIAVSAFVWLGSKKTGDRSQKPEGRRPAAFWLLASIFWLLSTGCHPASSPDDTRGDTGTGPGQFVYPRAIASNGSDNTYVVIDRMARVQRFDARGAFLNEWRMPEHLIGKPVGVSLSPDSKEVYVPDTHYHRVVVYSLDGTLLRQWGSEGTTQGQFIYPTDVAFDENGRVFVSEYGDNDRIQVFDRNSRFLFQFGQFGTGDGEFSRPQSMVIRDGLVYITDACNHRLVVFTTEGQFVRAMGGPGSDLGQFRFPYGLDIDHDGRLLVCEFGNNRVQLVDRQTGKGLATWGGPGHSPGQLAYPWAVATGPDDAVIVVDSGNNRLQVFDF